MWTIPNAEIDSGKTVVSAPGENSVQNRAQRLRTSLPAAHSIVFRLAPLDRAEDGKKRRRPMGAIPTAVSLTTYAGGRKSVHNR